MYTVMFQAFLYKKKTRSHLLPVVDQWGDCMKWYTTIQQLPLLWSVFYTYTNIHFLLSSTSMFTYTTNVHSLLSVLILPFIFFKAMLFFFFKSLCKTVQNCVTFLRSLSDRALCSWLVSNYPKLPIYSENLRFHARYKNIQEIQPITLWHWYDWLRICKKKNLIHMGGNLMSNIILHAIIF